IRSFSQLFYIFFFSSRRRHTISKRDWSSDVCSSDLDPYKPQLNEWMEQGIFNCVVLLERLRELGYDGGMSILKAYVHPYRPAKRSEERRVGKECRSRCTRYD